MFVQINPALVSIRDFLKHLKKSSQKKKSKLLTGSVFWEQLQAQTLFSFEWTCTVTRLILNYVDVMFGFILY